MADRAHRALTMVGIPIEPGLTDSQVRAAEAVIGAPLPPDLRAFLQEGLPIRTGFPDWRDPESGAIRQWLDDPFEGIAFDIEHSRFWWREWGPRPADLADALAVARARVAAAPRLIPLYSHRFLPAEPCLAGNPVFSIHQTDIICYGSNLDAYWLHEFGFRSFAQALSPEPRHIRFWSDLP